MTPKSIIASAGLITIAAVGYYFSSSMKPAQPGVENADTRTPVQFEETTEVESEVPQRVAHNVQADAPDPASKRFNPATGQFVEMEKVQGIWVRADRNCTVKIEMYRTAEDGTQTPIYSCKPDKPRPLDIYDTYSTEELKALAYHDSHAAHKLSVRLRETDFPLAVDYALRAAALSGEGKYIGMMPNLMAGYFVNGKKNKLEYIEQGYVLSGVASAYDMRVNTHARWARDALNHEGDGINIEALDARIVSLLQQIDSIREEVGLN